MKTKLSTALVIASLTIGTVAQESPVVTPLETGQPSTSPIPNPTIDPTPTVQDPAVQDPADPATPGVDPTAPPAFDISTTNNFQLDQTLTRARQLSSEGQLADAGSLLFHAAAAVEALSDPTRRDVSEAVASLRVLAFDTASHNATDPAQFRDAAASAHLSLATEQVLQARGSWGERRSVATGQALQLASFHLDRAIAWGDRVPNAEGASTLANANQVGAALVTSDPFNPVSPAAVQISIDQIAKMTATVGRAVISARGKDGLDERITEASRTAIEGIKKGSRKAAEKIGDRLQRWGAALQSN